MTVGELSSALANYNPEAEVFIPNAEYVLTRTSCIRLPSVYEVGVIKTCGPSTINEGVIIE